MKQYFIRYDPNDKTNYEAACEKAEEMWYEKHSNFSNHWEAYSFLRLQSDWIYQKATAHWYWYEEIIIDSNSINKFKKWDTVKLKRWDALYTITGITTRDFKITSNESWRWFTHPVSKLKDLILVTPCPTNPFPEPVTSLPKYFVIETDEDNPLWNKYIDWLNEKYSQNWRWNVYSYYWYDWWINSNWTSGEDEISRFKNNPTVITLEQWATATWYKKSNDKTIELPDEKFCVQMTQEDTEKLSELFKDYNFSRRPFTQWYWIHKVKYFIFFNPETKRLTYDLKYDNDYLELSIEECYKLAWLEYEPDTKSLCKQYIKVNSQEELDQAVIIAESLWYEWRWQTKVTFCDDYNSYPYNFLYLESDWDYSMCYSKTLDYPKDATEIFLPTLSNNKKPMSKLKALLNEEFFSDKKNVKAMAVAVKDITSANDTLCVLQKVVTEYSKVTNQVKESLNDNIENGSPEDILQSIADINDMLQTLKQELSKVVTVFIEDNTEVTKKQTIKINKVKV